MQFWWYLCHLKSNAHSVRWNCLDIRCSHTPKLCEEYADLSIAYRSEQKLRVSLSLSLSYSWKQCSEEFAWRVRFSTKSWYMYIHVAEQMPDQSAWCAVFLALVYSHIQNVNGAD